MHYHDKRLSEKNLKEIYGLIYDESGFGSGLIKWYNMVIEKTYAQLNVTDVSKMIRQEIVSEIAIKKAIELFVIDPYDGEMFDGDLLNTLVSVPSLLVENEVEKFRMLDLIEALKMDYINFDFSTKESKDLFAINLFKLQNMIV